MSVWQLMKNGVPTTDPLFDDGLQDAPGEDGFSTSVAMDHAKDNGANGVNYVGLSPAPPPTE